MRNFIKKIFINLPSFAKVLALKLYESYFSLMSLIQEQKEYSFEKETILHTKSARKNILIYHISGLGIGGTEKTLQILANGLSDDYNIFYLYSAQGVKNNRLSYISKNVILIPFSYDKKDARYPFYIHGMNPHIKNILRDKSIDLIITADSGHTQYPINTIFNVPVIFINIFGSPSVQKNIIATLFISETVKKHSEKYTGMRVGNKTIYIPFSSPSESAITKAKEIRERFGILETDFVFGRIGRASDDIFDPIAIEAFKKVVVECPHAHYIVMSPPPIMEILTNEQSIPNVHFLATSGEELDIWGFHYSLDCLAHFRSDGETFGLNIVESMYAGNPVISHTSHIWNAHLEYLTPEFSRVVTKGNVSGYSAAMKHMISLKETTPSDWERMRKSAKETAEKTFSEKNYIAQVKKLIKTLPL